MATFRDRLDEMLDGHEGDFVIKGGEILGYHADRVEAVNAVFEKFGTEPALVKKVVEQEPLFLGRVLPSSGPAPVTAGPPGRG